MERPLSPFMFPTWYRFQITSALSILHRLTGIALAVGSILLAWWLVAVASGGELFAATRSTRHWRSGGLAARACAAPAR
jgi:succinate dehydrogenase / fumarate reductase cytochrome b subunit